MPTYGLKDLHYAKISMEDQTMTTYETPMPLAPAMTAGISRSSSSANLRADDGILYTESAKGPATLTLGTSELPKQVQADLLGQTVASNGLLVSGDDDRPPYVAIGFKALDARGGYTFVWIYRVKFSVIEESSYQTKQETPEFSTPSLSGQSIARLDTGDREGVLWSEDPNVTDPTIFDEWFNEVIDPSWVSGV